MCRGVVVVSDVSVCVWWGGGALRTTGRAARHHMAPASAVVGDKAQRSYQHRLLGRRENWGNGE